MATMAIDPIEQIMIDKFASSRGRSKFLLASRHAEDFVRRYPHQSINHYAHRLQTLVSTDHPMVK